MTSFKTYPSTFITAVDGKEPLLADTAVLVFQDKRLEQDVTMEQNEIKTALGRNFFVAGVTVGVLSVFSDVGAHALLLLPGTHVQHHLHSHSESIILSLAGTAVFTIIVFCVLKLVMNIITASYSVDRPNGTTMLSEVCKCHLEGIFLKGALVGACTMWIFVDGMTAGFITESSFRVCGLVVAMAVLSFYGCVRRTNHNTAGNDEMEQVNIV